MKNIPTWESLRKKGSLTIPIFIAILGFISQNIFSSFSTYTDQLLILLSWPFQRLFQGVTFLSTQSHALLEWLLILVYYLIYAAFIYGIYQFMTHFFKKHTPQEQILCLHEIKKITNTIENNKHSLQNDTIFDLLNKFEDGVTKVFNIPSSKFICIWVSPEDPHRTPDQWNMINIQRARDTSVYKDIIATGVMRKDNYFHHLSNVSSYETDAKQFVFIKNIGSFRIGLAVIFLEENIINDSNMSDFCNQFAMIHYLGKLELNISKVL